MYRLMVLALLAGCAATVPVAGFRKPGTQIYSNAVLENERLIGDWVQVAEFAAANAPACTKGKVRIDAGLRVAADLCLNGARSRIYGPLKAVGPGRFAPPKGEEWWVLWADVGYRTLVIGTPSGRFGFILNRSSDLPPDRMRAAREVLEWNGYSVSRLR